MTSVNIQVNAAQMRDLQQSLAGIRHGVPMVLSRGINATAKQVQADSVDAIKKQIKVNKSAVKQVIKINKATYRKLFATVIYQPGARIPLINMSARQEAGGVSFKNWGRKGRGTREHAFIAKMPKNKTGGLKVAGAGHKGVFIRKIQEGERVARLPIRELYGPSISAIFTGSEAIVRKTMRKANGFLHVKINEELNKLLAKHRSKSA